MKSLFPLFSLLFLTFSCDAITGSEIARLAINEVSTKENIKEKTLEISLSKDDKISFWTEMDMSYEGEANMQFSVGLFLNDELIKAMTFDPREKNVSISEVKTDINGKVKWKFKGKNKTYKVLEDGTYTLKSFFIASGNVNLQKAELVIKK